MSAFRIMRNVGSNQTRSYLFSLTDSLSESQHTARTSVCFIYQLNSTSRLFSSSAILLKKPKDITINFQYPDDSVVSVKGAEGDSLLDLVVDNNVDIDGFGACEGTLACSTCHLILKPDDYDRIPDQPTDEEYDMLDLAYGLTDTSRLGCQIFCTKDLNDLTVHVPPGIADARS